MHTAQTIEVCTVHTYVFNKSFFLYADANENKTHPDHIQSEANGFPVGSVGSNGRITLPVHKNRLNGVVPRMNMNITPNPLADGDKVFRSNANRPVVKSYYRVRN